MKFQHESQDRKDVKFSFFLLFVMNAMVEKREKGSKLQLFPIENLQLVNNILMALFSVCSPLFLDVRTLKLRCKMKSTFLVTRLAASGYSIIPSTCFMFSLKLYSLKQISNHSNSSNEQRLLAKSSSQCSAVKRL